VGFRSITCAFDTRSVPAAVHGAGGLGVIPAHLSELSPDSVRGFLPGFAYQCGVLLAGSVAYIEALFAERVSYATAMSLTAVTVFAGAILVIALGREKRGINFGELTINE